MKLYFASYITGYNKIKRAKLLCRENEYPCPGRPYILESYYYIKNKPDYIKSLRPYYNGLLLDSGAYTYMTGKGLKVNWDVYVEGYAKFIKECNIDYFFELDIDSVVGLKEVERLRAKLEDITGKQCIPVWHRARGSKYWGRMISEYNYVAIGGIVSQEIKRKDFNMFIPMLSQAYKNNCKVHGLGFTNTKGLHKYHFHSVDSTSWLYGGIGGFIYHFTGNDILRVDTDINKVAGLRLKTTEGLIHNYKEWLKFSKYVEERL